MLLAVVFRADQWSRENWNELPLNDWAPNDQQHSSSYRLVLPLLTDKNRRRALDKHHMSRGSANDMHGLPSITLVITSNDQSKRRV